MATSTEIDGLVQHLERALTQSRFLDPDKRGHTVTRLRRLFARTQMDETEVQILRGVCSHIEDLAE